MVVDGWLEMLVVEAIAGMVDGMVEEESEGKEARPG